MSAFPCCPLAPPLEPKWPSCSQNGLGSDGRAAAIMQPSSSQNGSDTDGDKGDDDDDNDYYIYDGPLQRQ